MIPMILPVQAQRDSGVEGEDSECVVLVVGAFSDRILCTLQLPRSSTVLDVKRHVQACLRINAFRQRLIVSPAGPQAEDSEVLATLPGLRLRLILLEYADDDSDGVDLQSAASEGTAPEVERLLKLPLPPDGAQRFPPPLLQASSRGHLEVVRLLCEAGADKDKAAHDGFTALICAAANGHVEVVRLLCEEGADKDKARQDGSTALICASANGHVEVVRLLCEEEADKDKAAQDGCTALICASAHGHIEVVRLLCEEGADKDKAEQDGSTALICASANGHVEVVRLLCEEGAGKDKLK